ncbi:MAG: hypothetical protein MZV70_42665 [Desulfobacterales bacterium]|nr:hypothetical protein [Desulfobacterales bacterium]
MTQEELLAQDVGAARRPRRRAGGLRAPVDRGGRRPGAGPRTSRAAW